MFEFDFLFVKFLLIFEYKVITRNYLIYFNIYQIENIENNITFARFYHQTRRFQKIYTNKKRNSFIRFVLYKFLLKSKNLKAFFTNNDKQKKNQRRNNQHKKFKFIRNLYKFVLDNFEHELSNQNIYQQ